MLCGTGSWRGGVVGGDADSCGVLGGWGVSVSEGDWVVAMLCKMTGYVSGEGLDGRFSKVAVKIRVKVMCMGGHRMGLKSVDQSNTVTERLEGDGRVW